MKPYSASFELRTSALQLRQSSFLIVTAVGMLRNNCRRIVTSHRPSILGIQDIFDMFAEPLFELLLALGNAEHNIDLFQNIFHLSQQLSFDVVVEKVPKVTGPRCASISIGNF